MVLTIQSPFSDDETLTGDVGQLVEQFIKDNWSVSGILTTDIRWGYGGDQILQSGKNIVLKAYPYFQRKTPITINGSRIEVVDSILVDVYTMNNNLPNDLIGRDPNAVKILKFLDSLFLINQGTHYKGIYDFKPADGVIQPDEVKKSNSHLMYRLEVRYIIDVVNV